MAERLSTYKNQFVKPSYVDSSIDYFSFPDLLTPEDNDVRLKLR